ncbi:MAG: histidine phosphatase family protein [Kocuria sp.]|nr:histidine phosphatase family protein [Kocuria sp.]
MSSHKAASSATVHLLRHGQVYNPDRIVYGRLPDFHLSDLGHQMAEVAGQVLAQRKDQGANLVYLAASPLTRTIETATPVSHALGLEIHPDERLIEPRNHFEGLHVNGQELANVKHWPYMINPLRPSWGEPYRQQVARMAEVVVDAAQRAVEFAGDGAEAVLVSHQLPIWMARRSAEGKFLPHDPRTRQCNLASLTSLIFDDVYAGLRPRVVYSEPAAHLYSGVNQLPGS